MVIFFHISHFATLWAQFSYNEILDVPVKEITCGDCCKKKACFDSVFPVFDLQVCCSHNTAI